MAGPQFVTDRSRPARGTAPARTLDRIVTIQRKDVTRDSFGSQVVTFVDVDKVFASFQPMKGTESFVSQADRLLASRHGTWGVRYRLDIDETWRVVDDSGRIWSIVGIKKGHGLQLQCRSTDV